MAGLLDLPHGRLLMNKVVVRVVLTPIPIYLMIAMDLPKWVIKAIDKRNGKDKSKPTKGTVWSPGYMFNIHLQYGDIGIHNLQTIGWALRICWLWLQKTDASWPWADCQPRYPKNAHVLFDVAVATIVGNGESMKLWSDQCLHRKMVAELASNLLSMIPKRIVKRHTVSKH